MTEDDREPPVRFSGRWYREQTEAMLLTQLEGSMPGGPAFDGARIELERRQRDRETKVQLAWTKRTFWTALILGALAIVATLATAIL